MAKQSDTSLTGLIEIPIGTSRTGPMKRLAADLHDAADQLNRARNAMVRAWLRWREDHPDWQPPPMLGEDGKPKLTRKGEPLFICPMHPVHVAADGSIGEWEQREVEGRVRQAWFRLSDGVAGTGFETYLYHAGRRVAPTVASSLISIAAKEVLANLKTNILHHHGGKFRERWQAILANAEQAPTFMGDVLPVPNTSSMFGYAGVFLARKSVSKGDKKLTEYWGKSDAVLCFPLWSDASGRATRCPIVSLKVGPLSPGNRQLLKRIALGELKFRDSKLVHKKGRWLAQLLFERPMIALGLTVDRVATLWPQLPEADRPFRIEFAEKHWLCGSGAWLAAEYQRLDVRRKRIRARYKIASSGVKGPGRKRFEARLKPWARITKDRQRDFTWRLVAEVVRFCRANDCGSVLYREPTIGIRPSLWLGKRDVPYDWTTLSTDLSHKLREYGIEFTLVRVGGHELRERFGGEKKPGGTARETEGKADIGNATNGDAGSVANANGNGHLSRPSDPVVRKARRGTAGGAGGS